MTMPARPLNLTIVTLVIAFSGGLTALAQQPDETADRLEEIEREMEESRERRSDLAQKADAAEREIGAITTELVKSTARVQNREQALSALEARIRDLITEEAEAARALDNESQNMAETLAALQRLSQRPPELLLARPGKAVDTVRSATLLQSAIPELQRRAANIRTNIEKIETVRDELAGERADHVAGLAQMQEETRDLSRLKSRRQVLRRSLVAQAGRVTTKIDTLAAEARTLRDLLDRIRRTGSATAVGNVGGLSGAQSFASARGTLPAPARGLIVSRFGAETPTGASKGLRLRTRPGAQVIAPFDGRVVFSGPFRSYGQLLIIDHGGGYHTLLAGMTQIDAVVGQWLLAGEPVGVMGTTAIAPGTETTGKSDPELYLEIRRNGSPVNPLPWLAVGQGKASG